jgi:hypothetical protein
MNNRAILTGFAVVSLIYTFCLFPTECVSVSKDQFSKTAVTTPAVKPPAPAKPATPATTSPAQAELNAAIEKIFIKDKRVFVILNRAGSGRITPEDYTKIILRLETSRGPRQWSLAEVDKTRYLSSTGTGTIEFDTGILLDKTETVKAVLSLGKTEKPRQEMLAVTAAMASGPAPTAGKPIGTMAGQIDRQQAVPPRPVLMIFDQGIRIRPPVSSGSYYQGEPISVQYEWTHSSAPADTIVMGIESQDMSRNYAQVTFPAARSGAVTLTPPATMPAGQYTITAFNRNTGAFGRSDVFQVAANSARIDFLSPAQGDVYHPGGTMRVRYTLNRRVEPGTITFLFGSEGRVARLTQAYTPPLPDTNPLPEYTLNVDIPASTPTGVYSVIATHLRASGIGNNFSVQQRVWGTSHGVRVKIEGNPAVIFCNTPYTARLELTDPAAPQFYEPSFYYPGGTQAETFFLHLTSERSLNNNWFPAGWEAGSITQAADRRSMTGRFSIGCHEENTNYVMTFNHITGHSGDSPTFAFGSGPASLTALEPGKGGEHFIRNREHQVIWEYHPLVTATSLPAYWTIDFKKVDTSTGRTTTEYTLRSASPICTEERRNGGRLFRCQTTWNTSHLSVGTYKTQVTGGGVSDEGSLNFSIGNSGNYDLSINRIFWDEGRHELVAEVNNPDGVMGAIDFRVSHVSGSWVVPTIFPSLGSPVQIGLGTPGQLASSDRWSECRPQYTVMIDASNRVDERDELNNSLTDSIGPAALIRFETVTFDSAGGGHHQSLTVSPMGFDWDHHANGFPDWIFGLNVTNCGKSTASGWVSISQEGCLPGSGSGRLCPPYEYRAIKASAMEIAPGHTESIELGKSEVAHAGSTIIISFTGDLATFAPANPVRIPLDY